jgi:acid phosphatase (class A)
MLNFPEKRDVILACADDYARSRVVCGVHYRTDLEASKFVAYAMIGIMTNNVQFKQEVEAARAETRRTLAFRERVRLPVLSAFWSC